MAGYAKSWTDKYNDSWYLSLKLNERGIWDQLFTYAKLVGDTGRINARSWSALGEYFGCDARTCRKIVTKMSGDCKLDLKEGAKFLEIIIINYEYYQRVKQVGDDGGNAKMPQKCTTKQSRAEQSKAEQSREGKNAATDLIRAQRIKEKILHSNFAIAVGIRLPDSNRWLLNMVKYFKEPKFMDDQIERGLDSLIEHQMSNGWPVPTRDKIRPKIWQWIERQVDIGKREPKSDSDEYMKLMEKQVHEKGES